MPQKLNVLFIMTDQQRVDYLSIYGNRVLETPAMDRIGREGTVFSNAFVQSAVCGPSRACFYTGRYVHTHRSRWNEVPLPLTEKTLGHYFEQAGYRAAVIGKTHQYADYPKPDFVKPETITRDPKQLSRVDSIGFEYVAGAAWTPAVPTHEYFAYLKQKGYPGEGSQLIHNAYCERDPERKGDYPEPLRQPTLLKAEDSESHYLTDRAIQFMSETTDRPWLLHLSFFHPHHPNVAPYPYNEMYSEDDFPEPVRSESELDHPLFKQFRTERNRPIPDPGDATWWRHWRAVYAGLIKEIDDNLSRLFAFMDDAGLMDNTLIIFTSDHGEFAGDHWFFEKEMPYWQAYQVPLLIRCPGCPNGVTASEFAESVDIVPTCLEAAGLEVPPGVQGRSLLPFVHGRTPEDWRRETIAEWTFEYYNAPVQMGLSPSQCRAVMLRNHHYSYCHFSDLPDLLFDLEKDLNELTNVAEDPAHASVVSELQTRLLDWQMQTWDPLPLRIDTGWPRKLGVGPAPADLPYNFNA